MSAVSVVILGLFNVTGCSEMCIKKTEALVSQGNIAEVLAFCSDLCPASDTCHKSNHSYVPSIRKNGENKAVLCASCSCSTL